MIPYSRQFTNRPGAAFTLIELLVVLGIIGIIAGLLMPALAKAKRRSQSTYCASSTKQCALAAKMYADDANGVVVPEPNNSGTLWYNRLAPYLGANSDKSGTNGGNSSVIWGCPVWQANGASAAAAYASGFGLNVYPYMPNNSTDWNDGAAGSMVYYWDNVPTPATRLLVGDNQNGAIWTYAHFDYRHGDNNSLVNMSFFDGHTEPLNASLAKNSWQKGAF